MRRPAHVGSLAIAAALWLAACGSSSSSSGSLDCGWLGGSSNFWRSTAAAATSCLPGSSDTGKLSADLKSCTYTSGQVVTFSPALTLPLPQNPNFNFSVASAGGKPCFSFQEPNQQDFTEATGAGSASVNASGGAEVITCPNGSSVSASGQQALQDLGCDAGAFGGLPGTSWSSTSSSVSFTLLGAGTTGAMAILNCSM